MKVSKPLSFICVLVSSKWQTISASNTLEAKEDGAAAQKRKKVGARVRGTVQHDHGDRAPATKVFEKHVGFSPRMQDLEKEQIPTSLRGDYNATFEVSDVMVDRKLASPSDARVVCDEDTRTRIYNTDDTPWERIADLKITMGNSGYQCTGFFISKRVVMTAGHCVYIQKAGGWVDSVKVCPGAYDNGEFPYGCQYASSWQTSDEWIANESPNYDYAALILPDDTMWDRGVGHFGFRSDSDDTLRSYNLVNVAGYPGDKDGGDTLWWNAGPISVVYSRQITYPMDTAGGMSGGPVWVFTNDGYRYIVGIHTNGNCPNNIGVRIDDDLFEYMRNLKNLYT